MLAADGSHLGIMQIDVALAQATEQGLDLVEIAADRRPPVVCIMDYGKFNFEQVKQMLPTSHVVIHLKEIKPLPGLEDLGDGKGSGLAE